MTPKTAHGLIRGTERFDIIGVVDAAHAGPDAGEVLDGRTRNIMVYSSIADLLDKSAAKPEFAIVGVALSGGGFRQIGTGPFSIPWSTQLFPACGKRRRS